MSLLPKSTILKSGLISNRRCTSPTVRKVELLGSWDNFNRAYPMELDRRISAGHWRGCHTFTDIICDGGSESRSPGRNGGLKMGGTYWYYVGSILQWSSVTRKFQSGFSKPHHSIESMGMRNLITKQNLPLLSARYFLVSQSTF